MTITAIDLIGQRVATAVASYGTLRIDQLKSSLTDPTGQANFTTTQADAFVAQYDLVDQLPNVSLNGFSAAVFFDKTNDKHVIAMRGTEETYSADKHAWLAGDIEIRKYETGGPTTLTTSKAAANCEQFMEAA